MPSTRRRIGDISLGDEEEDERTPKRRQSDRSSPSITPVTVRNARQDSSSTEEWQKEGLGDGHQPGVATGEVEDRSKSGRTNGVGDDQYVGQGGDEEANEDTVGADKDNDDDFRDFQGKGKGKGKGKKRDVRRDGKRGPQAGVVLKISVSNFMCHRKLSISLCKQVNFINGRNGSGKSAILAALQICLGAKANSTHRAKKLTDFIRHGWSGDAELDVTLLNAEDGYKYEEYGDCVTVRRTIKRPNGGGYSLIGADGSVKSKDKTELLRMLDALNIQVDNPCAILDQENSKQFLQGSDTDKYNFFMRATDLSRILDDARAIAIDIQKMTRGHDEAQDQLPRYVSVVSQLRAEIKEFEGIEKLERKIRHLKEAMVWVHVSEAEGRVDKLDGDLKLKHVKASGFKERIEEIDKELEEFAAENAASKKLVEERVAETVALKAQVRKAVEELNEAKKPLLEMNAQRQQLMFDMRSKKDLRRRIEGGLQTARAKAMKNASGEKEKKLLADMDTADSQLKSIAQAKAEGGGDVTLARLRGDVKVAEDATETMRKVFQEKQGDMGRHKQYLQSLSSGKVDPLASLNRGMPTLVKRINQHVHKFTKPPLGPLGAMIKLKEESKHFAVPIEYTLRGCFTSFVVVCQQDKNHLMKIINECCTNNQIWDPRGGRPSIIVQQEAPRYNPPQAPPGHLQVMQAVTVSNDQAFNTLIDQMHMEKEGLFVNKEQAERACLVGRSGTYKEMPHGLRHANYLSGSNSFSRFNIVRGNQQTRSNVAQGRDRRVLGVDQGTQLAEAKEELKLMESVVHEARAKADQAARHLKSVQIGYSEEHKKQLKLANQERILSKERDRLNRELQMIKATGREDDPLQDLERKLEDARDELESLEQEVVTIDGQFKETSLQLKPLEAAKVSAQHAHQEATKASRLLNQQLDDATNHEVKRKQARAKLQAAVAQAENEAEEMGKDVHEAQSKCKDMIDKANKFMINSRRTAGEPEWDGEKVKTQMTLDQLRNKVEALKQKRQQEMQKRQVSGKSKQEVQEQLTHAVKVFQEKQDLAETLYANIKILHKEKAARLDKFQQLRAFIQQSTNTVFNDYLQQKGAAGEVRFVEGDRTLSLTYQKDNTDNSSQCDDVKLLSGGERSFATLALLLALGKQHECPFRVMDEFDVFMDAMSRNIAIKAVIDFALSHSNRQFIFITPQDLSSVTATDAIRIHKMAPPRKGDQNQATLEETFANAS